MGKEKASVKARKMVIGSGRGSIHVTMGKGCFEGWTSVNSFQTYRGKTVTKNTGTMSASASMGGMNGTQLGGTSKQPAPEKVPTNTFIINKVPNADTPQALHARPIDPITHAVGDEVLVPLQTLQNSTSSQKEPRYLLVKKQMRDEDDKWPVGSLFTLEKFYIGDQQFAKCTNGVLLRPYDTSKSFEASTTTKVGLNMRLFTTPVETDV